MKKILLFFVSIVLVLAACNQEKEQEFDASKKFIEEITELKEYFQIPGLAISVEKEGEIIQEEYMGYSDLNLQTKLNEETLFPIASLTKVFSGVLLLKLVEQGKLSLEDSLTKYFPELPIEKPIQIKHILSHTSQGDEIGEYFYYSFRFGMLTNVIEKASGTSFEEYLQSEIVEPLGLKNTYLLKDSLQVAKNNLPLVKPYFIEDGIKDGFVDYGYSASAGIITNLEDLAIFNNALDNNTLITRTSKEKMFSGLHDSLPYGYGIFSQTFNGTRLIWAYGQYDCYSSLLLKIPSKNLTLTLLANNNLMSDPARLIYGDVTSSLFSLSFLKNYSIEDSNMKLLETEKSLETQKGLENENFYRKKLLAQALASSFMSRFDLQEMETSKIVLKKVFTDHPNYQDYADLNLMHTLSFLKDVAFYRDLEPFNDFDRQIEEIGHKLLKDDPQNPYLNMYLGTYYSRRGNEDKAFYHFKNIVEANNFSRNWYTSEAENWIKKNKPDYKMSNAK